MAAHWLQYDGPTLEAYWEAKLHEPNTWAEFITLPRISQMPADRQREIWSELGKDACDA